MPGLRRGLAGDSLTLAAAADLVSPIPPAMAAPNEKNCLREVGFIVGFSIIAA